FQVGGANRSAIAPAPASLGNQQDQFLQQQQLATSDILKERKQKKEARESFLKSHKDTDTLKILNVGDKQVQALQIS
ncbi:hypothetical protein ABTN50_20625, partial [Acinetobacter baumannii]